MGIRERQRGQESNRLATQPAQAAPDGNPVMVFVMSLFAPPTMATYRIPQTDGALAQDYLGGRRGPLGLQLVLRRGKWDKYNRVTETLPRVVTCGDRTQGGASPPFQISTGRISDPIPHRLPALRRSQHWPVKGARYSVTNSGEIGERCAVNGQEQWILGGFEFVQNRCSDGPAGQRWPMRQIPVSGALSCCVVW